MNAAVPGPDQHSRIDRLLLRHSLRWRLPFFFGVVVVLVLASFLWATYREVERTLVGAGVHRASAAAGELAAMLSRSVDAAVDQGTALAAEPALRGVVEDPSPETRAAARSLLLQDGGSGLSRAEVWDADGTLVLDVTTPPDTTSGLQAFPAGEPPTGPGVSPLSAAGEFNYFDLVTAIPAASSAGGEPIGYLRRYARFTTTSGGTIQSLLGDEAVFEVGTPGRAVWTDFESVVGPPPPTDPRGQAGEHLAANRSRWIGADAAIQGTPMVLWVGYPRAMIIAPAQSFIRRSSAVALLLAAASVILMVLLSIRLTKPLRALSQAADRIAGGDYTRRVQGGGQDEIARLRRAFNTMADRIEEVLGNLREIHERTQFTLAAARIGVWEADIASGRMSCSESMSLVHDLPGEELPKTRAEFLELVHADDRESVRGTLEGRVARDGEFDIRYRALTPDGSTRFVEGKGRLHTNGTSRPATVVGVSIDMTDQMRLESQLRQSQKMEAMGMLAGGVAHDFNNLLTAIVGHGSLLLDELRGPENEEPREEVKAILSASESAAGLTRQLLTFSRRKVAQPQVVELNEVVASTEKLLRRLIGADIAFVTSLAPDLHTVRIDPGMVEQVLVNLAVNARDAMPDGGTLTIATSNVYLDETYVRMRAAVQSGPYVMMAVTDTGTGMDAETQARLFEPFFTTKGAGQGTGLGLATVFGIVKQHEGEIYVYSEPGRGTTFKVYLPATDEAATATIQRLPVTSVRGSNRTILVVEDNAPVRSIAQTILERHDYRVTAAADGQDALRLLEASGERPDLVVSDVVMPGMTGPELARELERRYPGIRLIFTSGYAGEALGRHGIDAAGVSFLEKPYSPADLVAKVGEALGTNS